MYYVRTFQEELQRRIQFDETITFRCGIRGGQMVTKKHPQGFNIKGIQFTGALRQLHFDHNSYFSIVEKVCLIMKFIFDEKTSSISENGTIMENPK